jgi:carbamoyltransferase
MSRKPVFVLGTGLSHDGSSALMRDGKIMVAIEKERLTGIRHDGFNDNATIQYCLDAAGIRLSDVALIVEKNTFNTKLKPQEVSLRSGRILPESAPVVRISHHLAHAYSAIGPSPFDEAGVVVMDGQGSSLDNCIDVPRHVLPPDIASLKEDERYLYWEKESYYVYENARLTPMFKDFSHFLVRDRTRFPAAPEDMEHSIAEFFGGIATYVFGRPFSEGKLMGLAPYGRVTGEFGSAFHFDGPRVFLREEWMSRLPASKAGQFRVRSSDFQFYADLACWAQREIEGAILHVFRAYSEISAHENVAYAGGLALNAVANRRIIKEGPFDRLYVQPAAGDGGLAIGCCYYGWCEVLGHDRVFHDGRSWFGVRYPAPEVERAMAAYNGRIDVERCEDYIQQAADLLSEGFVIGWFQDESEFGPRALGNRSILASPAHASVRDHINRRIKFREEFRPFAPIVLSEEAECYFQIEGDARYMTVVASTREEWREHISAVVHVDGTARVQIVEAPLLPKVHRLLCEFKRRTGIGVLLNTSFNTRGRPIIERPEQAIDCLLETALHAVVMESYVIRARR